MTSEQLKVLCAIARSHANNLRSDINNASTRIEHIRLTTLAIEADNLASSLENIRDGSDVHNDALTGFNS